MAVELESPSIHYVLEEIKKTEETPVKQNTGGAISSSSPMGHLNSGHRLLLRSVVRELPGLRGSITSPTLFLRHGTLSRIGHSFQCGLTSSFQGYDLEQSRGKELMYGVNHLWEVSRVLSIVS